MEGLVVKIIGLRARAGNDVKQSCTDWRAFGTNPPGFPDGSLHGQSALVRLCIPIGLGHPSSSAKFFWMVLASSTAS